MSNILSGDRYKVAVGLALLLLVALIAADIWLWQGDDDSGTGLGPGQGVSDGTAVPGLPSPRSTDGSNASSDTQINDSVDVVVQRGGEPGLEAGDSATLSDGATLETSGEDPGVTVSDGAAVNDSAELDVQRQPPPPPSGGPADDTNLGDSAGLVVRDAEGNIKLEQTVK